MISYIHENDHKENKTRFVQFSCDTVPNWTSDIQPYYEGENDK
jgi:hypothetical protein